MTLATPAPEELFRHHDTLKVYRVIGIDGDDYWLREWERDTTTTVTLSELQESFVFVAPLNLRNALKVTFGEAVGPAGVSGFMKIGQAPAGGKLSERDALELAWRILWKFDNDLHETRLALEAFRENRGQ